MNAGAVWISTRRSGMASPVARTAPIGSDHGGPSSQVGINFGHKETRTTPGRATPIHYVAGEQLVASRHTRDSNGGGGEGVDEW